MKKVFIDGQAGTTGLQLERRLAGRDDLALLRIDESERKSPEAKRELMADADVTVLCLPDDASQEAAQLAPKGTRLLDASTAFRTHKDWVYGLPELGEGQRGSIAAAERVANPGCYSTGFIAAVRPLVAAGVLAADAQLTASAISGYTGGGRRLIERYQAEGGARWPVRPYALRLAHKHLPEMAEYSGLQNAPLFMPSVGQFAQGMLVLVPLAAAQMQRPASSQEVQALLAERYADEPCIAVRPLNFEAATDDGYLDPQALNGTNLLELLVFGEGGRTLVAARLDNLGKGASGAAVQNLNLMLALPELASLNIKATSCNHSPPEGEFSAARAQPADAMVGGPSRGT